MAIGLLLRAEAAIKGQETSDQETAMKSFPMFIRTTGRRVVIAGGGEQAAQKSRLIKRTDAEIVLAAPEFDEELGALVAEGRARTHSGPITPALFEGAAMAFIASGCPAVDSCLQVLAVAARCPVNVVDRPDLCEITTPSLVDRDPVVVAIGTEGTGPVLARQIKTGLETVLAPDLGGLAALAGELRDAVAARVEKDARRAFWRWVFAEAPRKAWERGDHAGARALIEAAIAAGGAPDLAREGAIAFVGAGPGARDLVTLRAVARLQEADAIFHAPEVSAEVLELARRDAEREVAALGDAAAALAAAGEGAQVVRLVPGDVAAVCAPEIAAARAAGIAVEIVPGLA